MTLNQQLPNILSLFELKENATKEQIDAAIAEFSVFVDQAQKAMKEGSFDKNIELYESFQELQGVVESEISSFCDKLGVNPKELDGYLNNPKNYKTEEEFEYVQGLKNSIEKELGTVLEEKKSTKKASKLKRKKWMKS